MVWAGDGGEGDRSLGLVSACVLPQFSVLFKSEDMDAAANARSLAMHGRTASGKQLSWLQPKRSKRRKGRRKHMLEEQQVGAVLLCARCPRRLIETSSGRMHVQRRDVRRSIHAHSSQCFVLATPQAFPSTCRAAQSAEEKKRLERERMLMTSEDWASMRVEWWGKDDLRVNGGGWREIQASRDHVQGLAWVRFARGTPRFHVQVVVSKLLW